MEHGNALLSKIVVVCSSALNRIWDVESKSGYICGLPVLARVCADHLTACHPDRQRGRRAGERRVTGRATVYMTTHLIRPDCANRKHICTYQGFQKILSVIHVFG